MRPAHQARLDAVELGVQLEVLLGGQVAVERRVLEDQADVAADVVARGRDVVAGDGRGARGGLGQRAEHVDRRRLPGAVRAEEAEDLAGLDGERDAADGLDVPERLAQFVDFDHVDCKSTATVSECTIVALMEGLRERKKRQTRDAIAAAALALFLERGLRRRDRRRRGGGRRRVREDGLQLLPDEGGPRLRERRGEALRPRGGDPHRVRRARRCRGSSRPRRCRSSTRSRRASSTGA